MRRLVAVLLAVVTSAIAAPAMAADCDLRATTSAAFQTYDPFAPNDTVIDLAVTVRNNGSRTCEAQVFLAPADGTLALTANSISIPYRVDGPRTGTGDFGPYAVRIAAGDSKSVPVRLVVAGQQIVPRGEYTTSLLVRGTDDTNNEVAVSGGLAAVTLRVPARVDVSIAGTRATSLSAASFAPAILDLGTARQGQTGRLYVGVWSNGPVTISISSSNGGMLRQVERPDLTPISYTATFDGAPLALGGISTLQRMPPMSLGGASYELTVTLGPVDGRYAGQYRDVISVNVDQN